MLVPRFDALAATLRAFPGADPTQLSPTAHAERGQALADLDALCLEVLDLDFRALAFGQPPPPYDDRCPFHGLASFLPEDRFGVEIITHPGGPPTYLLHRVEAHTTPQTDDPHATTRCVAVKMRWDDPADPTQSISAYYTSAFRSR